MNETDLISKGFRQQPDGSWAKPNRSLGAVEGSIGECDPGKTLDGGIPIQEGSAGSVEVRVSVVLIGLRRRVLLDGDNFVAGCKPLRDAIAESLRVDDGDARIDWSYHQLKTTGPEGTIVLISV